jgi:YYY domain-containing protein
VLGNWLAREGWMIVQWWLLVTLAGVAVLPLCLRLLRALPDRGYLLARAAGLLLTGFVFWLLAAVGLMRSNAGGVVVAWMIVLIFSLIVYFREGHDENGVSDAFNWRTWWRENRSGIIIGELVFASMFLAWSIYRAYQNGITYTERPMDLAFLSAISRGNTFPPNDPWLAGYSISYYYFGYILAGMLTKASGLATTITYNLWTALLFGLTALTTYGVLYNLVKSRQRDVVVSDTNTSPSTVTIVQSARPRNTAAILVGLVGVVIIQWMGNWEAALIELPYHSGTASQSYLDFWDVNTRQEPLDVVNAPLDLGSVNIDFFRAARSMNDRFLPEPGQVGKPERTEVINEFPQFSFLLGDNHPHVMALPFTILAIGLALNVALHTRKPNVIETVVYGILVGSLVFLNTWDTPIYLTVLVAADVLRRWHRAGRLTRNDWIELVIFGAALVGVMLLAYLPFLANFRSQAGGILPNVIWPTPVQQYLLTFGALVPLVAIFLLVEAWRGSRNRRMNWSLGLQIGLGLLLLLVSGAVLLIVIGALSPSLRQQIEGVVRASGGLDTVIPAALGKRFTHILTSLLLTGGLILVAGRIFSRPVRGQDVSADSDETANTMSSGPAWPLATGFALTLIGAGLAVTLFPEFLYLRDNFGTRMNTIFKFYYAAWTLFAIGSTYGLYSLLADAHLKLPVLPVRLLAGAGAAVAIALGLIYPLYSIRSRAINEATIVTLNGQEAITLDGWRTVVLADDYTALTCLSEIVGNNEVTIAEATDGGYDTFLGTIGAGRTGAFTGMPTVIGWSGHQGQWRGSSYGATVGSRPDEIRRLYTDLRLDQVMPILEKYEVDYILYGPVERSSEKYGSAGEQKFLEFFDIVCESGDSRIYRVDTSVQVAAQ